MAAPVTEADAAALAASGDGEDEFAAIEASSAAAAADAAAIDAVAVAANGEVDAVAAAANGEADEAAAAAEDKKAEAPPLHPVFKAVADGDIDAVREHFEVSNVPLEIADENGMTSLMHACWKGNARMAKFLIQQGADVNGGSHTHGYTALHFAALAGKADVCLVLMEAGVKIDRTNSVNRTASQMAAFVGNHEAVAIINNYVPKEDVYYYTRKQPLETEAKLPLSLAKPIHELVMSMNANPVKVALILKANPEMLEKIGSVCKILELMSDREFKNRQDVNEVLSLKFHMLYYILKDVKKQLEKDAATEKKIPFIDRWIKSMLVGRDSDGYPVFQENFLRQGVKEFPFPEAQLFKALVANFHHCRTYGESVTAAEYINSSFNGQQGFKGGDSCDTCGCPEAPKKCATCKSVQYCDQSCQKFHWFVHKKMCSNLKERYEDRQKESNAADPES